MQIGITLLIICLCNATLAVNPIATKSGPVQGTDSRDESVEVFKGIPYAAPPVGELRWKPPQPPAAWTSVRICDEFGPSSLQKNDRPGQSEDCLYLNIWTSRERNEGSRPVMVWIHGGGFTKGSGHQAGYDGTQFARRGVVLVTINYRLGAFGFMTHPALSAESPHGASGNYAILDQIEALKWIRDNISNFGGDPDKVTIFGESAGGISVYLLTATPLSKGLFRRAILQSPWLDPTISRDLREENENGPPAEFDGEVQIRQLFGEEPIDVLAKLRAMPAQELLEKVKDRWPVATDGWVFPKAPYQIYASGDQHDIPVIVGTNRDEGTMFTPRKPFGGTLQNYRAAMVERYGEYGDRVADLCVAALSLSLGALQPAAMAGDGPLNVLLIMADDIGFECFSSYGSKEYSTPRIDALAKQGIRFTNAHSTPLCTPSRVNLMSGKSNVFNYQDFGIYPHGEPTFANHFKEHGYRTAVAGKWQLQSKQPGKGITPTEAGFDTYCLWNIPGGARERYWKPSFVQNGKLLDLPPDTFGPDVMTDFLIDFMIEENDKPFAAYYPMILVHDPFVPTPDSNGGTRVDKAERTPKQLKKNYIDMVAYMDKCVGKLVDALEANGKRDNTLVIFTGDNGTNAALASELDGKTVKGGKGYTHDYGTHVPLVVNLPGRIPPGQVNDDLIAFSDFFPTIVESAGLPAKDVKHGDGWSFWPQCLGQPGRKRQWIYGYYFPRPYAATLDNKYNHFEVRYARNKRYKLYGKGDLYDTIEDVMEKTPLPTDTVNAKQQAAREKLQLALEAYPAKGQSIHHDKVSSELKPDYEKRSNY